MISELKAEFRKLLSVRSTYLLTVIGLLLGTFISFWIFGYKDVQKAGMSPDVLASSILNVVSIMSLFLSFLAVLLVGHEYRYNLITYTLTSARRRTNVFFAKLLATNLLAIGITALMAVASVGLFYLGQHMAHVAAIHQTVNVTEILWRSLATIIASITFAFIITMLLRSLIGAIALVLVLPTTVETLLGLLLKENTKYLPYTALGNLTSTGSPISYIFSIKVALCYAVGLGLVAYLLFLRRDAN